MIQKTRLHQNVRAQLRTHGSTIFFLAMCASKPPFRSDLNLVIPSIWASPIPLKSKRSPRIIFSISGKIDLPMLMLVAAVPFSLVAIPNKDCDLLCLLPRPGKRANVKRFLIGIYDDAAWKDADDDCGRSVVMSSSFRVSLIWSTGFGSGAILVAGGRWSAERWRQWIFNEGIILFLHWQRSHP